MLVLTRKLGESITIGEGVNRVVVTFVQLNGGKVRLGIDADPSIIITRTELFGKGRDVNPREALS